MRKTNRLAKRLLSLALALIMALGVCAAGVPGIIAFAESLGPVLVQLNGGDKQQHTVANYQSAYAGYKSSLMGGYAVPMDGSNGNQDICVPGLSSTDNMVPQGLTYWPAKNWILISSYSNGGSKASRIYAVSAVTGHLVAQFNLYSGGSISTDHVSGIACSANNLYIASSGSTMSYIPLSELDVSVGTVKNVSYADTVSMSGVLNGANTSYASYGDGVLWTGNFYIENNSNYNTKGHPSYGSMLYGFTVDGYVTSSAEWNALKAIAGNPSYAIPLDSYGINKVQCATVKNGFCYVGTSYGRDNDSTMYIFNVDLMSSNGTFSVNGNTKPLIPLKNQRTYTHLPMTEGLLVFDGYLWNIFESASYLYNGQGDLSKNPTDVLWRFDISSLLGIEREADDEASAGDTQYKASNVTCGDLTFIVPETIYLAPKANSNSQATSANFQYYINNTSAGATQSAAGSTGKIYYTYSGASTATISYKFYTENLSTTLSGGSVSLSSTSISSGNSSGVTINSGSSPTLNAYENGCYIEWKLSYTDSNDGKAKAAYAYTYVYKPYVGVIAAAGRIRHTSTEFFMQSVAYMYGIHSVPQNGSYSTRGDLTRVFYDNLDGLRKDDGTNADNNAVEGLWVQSGSGTASYHNYGNTSSDGKNAEATAPRGVLNVDTSRYSNFNQIPNFKIGWQCSDDQSSNYYCIRLYLGDGTGTRIDPKKDKGSKGNPDGDASLWLKPTQMSGAITSSTNYAYFHTDCASGKSHYIWNVLHVYCDIQKADKSSLRSAVQNATKAMAKLGVNGAGSGKLTSLYFDTNNDYRWIAFQNAYKAAVMALTKVGCSDISGYADELNHALANLCTKVSYDANGGSLIGIPEDYITIGVNQSASYTVLSDNKATRKGYTFLGWNLSNSANSAQNSVTVGYNNTFYAVWVKNNYTVHFDGNGNTGGSMSDQTFTYDTAQNLTANAFTKQYNVTYKNNNGTADTAGTGSYAFDGWSGDTASELLINEPFEHSKDFTSGPSGNYQEIIQWTINAPFAANEVYFLEFDAKGTGNITNYFYGDSNYWPIAKVEKSDGTTSYGSDGNATQALTSSYKHYTVRWTLAASGNANVNKHVLFRVFGGSSATVKNIGFYKITGTTNYTNQQSVNNLCSTANAVYTMKAKWAAGPLDNPPTPTYANHAFVGWCTDAALENLIDTSTYTASGDVTLYAKWIKPANDDSYVVDMGSGTKLNVLGNDASGATLNPVSSGSDDYNLSIADNQIVFKATSAISAPVTFNYSVTYNSAPYTAAVTVIPATSVYYEEDVFSLEGTWTDAGTAVQNAFATIDEAYGYDDAYNASTASYSMGTAKKATVSKTNTKGPKAQFTFTGTGFEVYSLTSSETGLVVITIKQGDTQILKTMVNTYFGNAYGQLYLTSD
ncbi:MAG: InlB B-repeat-containing protein, partial [Clostridia bacterium]|nr:InlB B-repeat-containing protein [Clostridia bacterium]